jgi:hypothetical protein
MPPAEFWWLIESKMPKSNKPDFEDMSDIRAMVKAAKAEEAAQNG